MDYKERDLEQLARILEVRNFESHIARGIVHNCVQTIRAMRQPQMRYQKQVELAIKEVEGQWDLYRNYLLVVRTQPIEVIVELNQLFDKDETAAMQKAQKLLEQAKDLD